MNVDLRIKSCPFRKIVRISIGLVFLVSCVEKIGNPAAFADIVTRYQLLPPALVMLTAIIFPWVELFCGLALVLGRLDKGATFLVCLMMTAFILIAGYNGYRGLNIACGCFSLSAKAPSHIAVNIARNMAILVPAMGLLLWPIPNRQKDRSASFPTGDRL